MANLHAKKSCAGLVSVSLAISSILRLISSPLAAGVALLPYLSPERLHSGVLRDLERQNHKKENIRLLEEQIALTKQLMEERDKALMEKRSQQS
ncbi:protein PET117 homolog, mitochondrial [Egretta garzetta]|uniref:protein PET117 homolog, mitochondrial n=1 Tax=Egretta garzetta TaxID=188379 RepID=UPI00051F0E3B|nr:protein PET117 homolog, mitochondrial [Egretta garzetta]